MKWSLFLHYSTTATRNIKENMLSASRREQTKWDFASFYSWVTSFSEGAQKVLKNNYSPFIPRTKLRTLKWNKPDLCRCFNLCLVYFNVILNLQCDYKSWKESGFFFSAYYCSHTQSTFITKGRRQESKGIVLKISNTIKTLTNLSPKIAFS